MKISNFLLNEHQDGVQQQPNQSDYETSSFEYNLGRGTYIMDGLSNIKHIF
jgi:hypothetical protein